MVWKRRSGPADTSLNAEVETIAAIDRLGVRHRVFNDRSGRPAEGIMEKESLR